MILKIKAANLGAEESWRFFDGVEGLHYSKYPMWPAEMANQIPSEDVPDVQKVYFASGTYHSPIVVMCFHSETTGAIEITCDTEAYLLNDQGRTIERLI